MNPKKRSIKHAGEACRKCFTPVVRREPKHKRFKPDQWYYFKWYLVCPTCGVMYMVDEAKVVMTDRLTANAQQGLPFADGVPFA